MINRIRGIFLVNTRLDVLTRIEQISFPAADVAEVHMQAAMLGNTGGGVLGVDAEFYNFELEMIRAGSDWQIVGAVWEPVLGNP